MTTETLAAGIEAMISAFRTNRFVQIEEAGLRRDGDAIRLDFSWTVTDEGEEKAGPDYEDWILGGEAHIRLPAAAAGAAYLLDNLPGELEVWHMPADDRIEIRDTGEAKMGSYHIPAERYAASGIPYFYFYGWQKAAFENDVERSKVLRELLGTLGLSVTDQMQSL